MIDKVCTLISQQLNTIQIQNLILTLSEDISKNMANKIVNLAEPSSITSKKMTKYFCHKISLKHENRRTYITQGVPVIKVRNFKCMPIQNKKQFQKTPIITSLSQEHQLDKINRIIKW